jgi:hypothetical protein
VLLETPVNTLREASLRAARPWHMHCCMEVCLTKLNEARQENLMRRVLGMAVIALVLTGCVVETTDASPGGPDPAQDVSSEAQDVSSEAQDVTVALQADGTLRSTEESLALEASSAALSEVPASGVQRTFELSGDDICPGDIRSCVACPGGYRTKTLHYTATKTWDGWRCDPSVIYGTCYQACAL